MIQEIRKELIYLFNHGPALQWTLPPTLSVESLTKEQARYLGYQVVYHKWDNHESRMMFRNVPQSLLAYSSSSLKPTLFIIEGFWRWEIYSKQVRILIDSLTSSDRILFIDDCLNTPLISGVKRSPFLISKIQDFYSIEQSRISSELTPEAWIQSLTDAPFEFDLYEEMDQLIESGANGTSKSTRDIRTQLFDFLTKNLPFQNYGDDLLSMELLLELLRTHLGQTLQYEGLKEQLGVSGDTIKRWITSLTDSGLLITVSPHSKGLPRALKNDKKFYFFDWGLIPHGGSRVENLIASSIWCFLKKQNKPYELQHIKTKEGITVDFVITLNECPLVAIDLVRSEKTEVSRGKKAVLHTLGCPYIQVTQDPLTWVKNEQGSLISLPYLLIGL